METVATIKHSHFTVKATLRVQAEPGYESRALEYVGELKAQIERPTLPAPGGY